MGDVVFDSSEKQTSHSPAISSKLLPLTQVAELTAAHKHQYSTGKSSFPERTGQKLKVIIMPSLDRPRGLPTVQEKRSVLIINVGRGQ